MRLGLVTAALLLSVVAGGMFVKGIRRFSELSFSSRKLGPPKSGRGWACVVVVVAWAKVSAAEGDAVSTSQDPSSLASSIAMYSPSVKVEFLMI